MSCCCTKTLDICDTPVCGVLELPLAAESGSGENEYSLVLDFLQLQMTLTQSQTDGENITFDISALNEKFQYTGQVKDSNGEVVTFTVDAIEYDCIRFKTVLNVNI